MLTFAEVTGKRDMDKREPGEEERQGGEQGGGAVTAAAASAPTCQPGLQCEHGAIFPSGVL